MLKLCSSTKIKVLFLVLVYVFNFDLFEISAAILEKGLLTKKFPQSWSFREFDSFKKSVTISDKIVPST